MKKTKGAILGYVPGPVPADLPPSAREYLDTELNRIAGVQQAVLAQLQAVQTQLQAFTNSTNQLT